MLSNAGRSILLAVSFTAALLLARGVRADEPPVDFNRQIRPLLAKHCLACHGPDEDARQAGLRLDRREDAIAELDSGERAIVPEDSASSELIWRVSEAVEDERMPPEGEGKPLTDEEVELLERWIDQGAPWGEHWSFVKPRRPPVPSVKDEDWPRVGLDYFVLQGLEEAGLGPSSRASRHKLIRRVSLDLTGLPPTIEQVEAFVNDSSPDAYERVVDRLLASPAFGERWARVWLDLARYADTNGYEKDGRRSIWPYRDWVIRALNRDLSFDRFTIEQLAGDMLPDADVSRRIATGFHRNTMTNTEGGTDDEEFRDAAVVDRINTTMQVWMGVTFGCCQCHSHKYDPLTQEEYYRFFALFNQTEDSDKDDNRPTLDYFTPEQRRRLTALDEEIETAEAEWASLAEESAERAAVGERVARLKKEQESIRPAATPVMRELPEPKRRATQVHIGGSFLNLGDEVAPGVPSVFPPLPTDAPTDRLSAARWLVSRENPLTARVTVNRVWEKMFGVGIVESSEDFGTQGTPPSNQALLDWLAIEFMEGGWSLKKLCRAVVTSSAYGQTSRVTAERLEKDPFNRLISRGPRFRLEAETVRDQALAVAGLLSRKMHGPSVMPPQPDGIWQVVYSGDKWETSAGEDRYRRGLYTFWRRTSPYPSMMTFDATSREVCSIRRIRTNTPLAALVTLNDPVYVEAAQSLARVIMREGGDGVQERAAFAVRRVLGRPARREEVRRLVALHETELEHYRRHPDEATRMATMPRGPVSDGVDIPRLAAWTVVSNVLLNLDELLMKD